MEKLDHCWNQHRLEAHLCKIVPCGVPHGNRNTTLDIDVLLEPIQFRGVRPLNLLTIGIKELPEWVWHIAIAASAQFRTPTYRRQLRSEFWMQNINDFGPKNQYIKSDISKRTVNEATVQ